MGSRRPHSHCWPRAGAALSRGRKGAVGASGRAAPMGPLLLGGVGAVTDVHPFKRDEHGLPNPVAGVANSAN